MANLNDFVGVALNGVLISSGLSTDSMNVDPIYPTVYDTVTNPSDA